MEIGPNEPVYNNLRPKIITGYQVDQKVSGCSTFEMTPFVEQKLNCLAHLIPLRQGFMSN